tara:strand:- start:1998 stop:2261 length:264 start_codon:yes stop_codon:yes gene_type:complete
MGSQSTAEYYKKNPKAKARRLKQQKAYMQTEKGKEIRRNADRLSAKLGGKVGDGLDAAHYKGSKTNGRLQKASTNRRSRLKVKKGGK